MSTSERSYRLRNEGRKKREKVAPTPKGKLQGYNRELADIERWSKILLRVTDERTSLASEGEKARASRKLATYGPRVEQLTLLREVLKTTRAGR